MERPARTSISEAALDVIEAGQQLVLDRIDLVRNDALRIVSTLKHQVVFFLAAAVLLATAWIAFNCTATMFLAERYSWVVAGAITGSINAIVGLMFLVFSAKERTSE